ncbi:MAG: hypothetical protein NNA21_03735 [Nitrospira sp.]|nr:hypothetical protein [Nitrospira sp.]MCP9474522.1 hypothetical protein [Nitrospira sp.]
MQKPGEERLFLEGTIFGKVSVYDKEGEAFSSFLSGTTLPGPVVILLF